MMRKKISFAVMIALITMLAVCGGNVWATEEESTEEKMSGLADKFVFRTGEEISAFMEPYTGKQVLKYSEPWWSMQGDAANLQGNLTPDKSAFTSINISYRNKKEGSGTPPEEILWAFYQDFCDKAGTSFPEAEEKIRSISSLEDESVRFENGSCVLEVEASSNHYEVSVYRTNSSCDNIPYTPGDARAFMEGNGGKVEKIYRRVSDEPEILTGAESKKYAWSGSLDAQERLYSVSAEYYGEDSEEGKEFFTAFIEYLLTGDVLEEGKKLILDHYDTVEANETIKAEMNEPYSMSLYRKKGDSGNYRIKFSVSSESIPSGAPVFPNEDELAALQLDPIARKGIDKTLGLPETVIFTQDNIKIILEGSYYSTFPELRIKIRMEGASENTFAKVDLSKINGQDVDFDSVMASSGEVSLNANQPEDEMYLKLPALLDQVPDFTGLSSITVRGNYQADMDSQNALVMFEDVTCGANP